MHRGFIRQTRISMIYVTVGTISARITLKLRLKIFTRLRKSA
jgi:hypothetical protein